MTKDSKEVAKWVVIAALVVGGYKVLKDPIQKFFANIFSKGEAQNIVKEIEKANVNGSVRTTLVQGIVNSVETNIKRTWQDERSMVRDMNDLANKDEVVYAATYYKNSTGRSLKTDLKEALSLEHFMFYGKRYSDLKDYVKNNLF